MYYGSEKQEWMQDAVNQFNALHLSACDGPISVNAIPCGSGDAMQQILSGNQPDIWSPAGRIWLNLLNMRWQTTPGNTGDLIESSSIDSPSLFISPVVIAMWQSRAEALGWPNKQLGWSDMAALSAAPQGWAAYGHADWGMFHFAHTSPRSSNSGLDALVAEYYAALDKQSGLSLADVDNPQARSFVAGIERSIIYYGGASAGGTCGGGTNANLDSTGFFARAMCQQGPSELSAAVLYESLVVELNEGKLGRCADTERVVALYPKEGTFISDHPFAIPHWVTPAKRTAALAFRNFLLARTQQQKALGDGFRPTDLSIPVAIPLTSANGVDPAQPKTTLKSPSLDVVQNVQDAWEQLRHRVAVSLLLDTSGSMNFEVGGITKITAAKDGLRQFIGRFTDDDWVGLTTFSTDMHVMFPVAPLSSNRQPMLQAIDGITAEGSTRLYNSIADQVQALSGLTTDGIKALVVLTDGVDTANQLTLAQLLEEIGPLHVRVFSIAYGDPAYIDTDGLKQMAQVTGGQAYGSTPQDIQQAYSQIGQFLVGP
jgi:Ca-activated chloride channel family protein